MPSYCITFEIHSGREDRVVAALELFGDRIKVMPGVWLVATPWTAEEISGYLEQFVSEDDILHVNQIAAGQGWHGWMRGEVEQWLREHLGE